MITDSARATLPMASPGDTLAVLAEVVLPTLSKGVIIRRPKVMAVAETLNLDQRAIRCMQRLRAKYGPGPLLLRIPLRSQAVVLVPDHVHRVLGNSPEPFATASSEKRATLSHFEPENVLISHGAERTVRRRFNDEVLDSEQPVHQLAESFVAVVDEEVGHLRREIRHDKELNWELFSAAWSRIVRRIVLGESARDDHDLTELLARLRSNANWAFMRPKQISLRMRLHRHVEAYLARAEPHSLASMIAAAPVTRETAPSHQVAQWLFAFDPAAIATYRALALLATHPEHAARARQEIQDHPGPQRRYLPYLRACVRESLRLWPTTPAILRQTTTETQWDTGTMRKGTGILIFAPFFHRDDERSPVAHRFAPEIWLENAPATEWALVPFSRGPATCPAHHLVPMLGSATLATLLNGTEFKLTEPERLDPGHPLPGTLNNYSLRFIVGD